MTRLIFPFCLFQTSKINCLKNFALRTQLEWVSVEMKNFPNSFLNKQWQRRRLGISNFLNPHKFGILQSLEILKATVKYDLRSRNLNAILSITFYSRLPQQFFREPESVMSTPQFHKDPISSTHQFNTRTTPFQHRKSLSSTPKSLDSTPKTPQFNTPRSSTSELAYIEFFCQFFFC